MLVRKKNWKRINETTGSMTAHHFSHFSDSCSSRSKQTARMFFTIWLVRKKGGQLVLIEFCFRQSWRWGCRSLQSRVGFVKAWLREHEVQTKHGHCSPKWTNWLFLEASQITKKDFCWLTFIMRLCFLEEKEILKNMNCAKFCLTV